MTDCYPQISFFDFWLNACFKRDPNFSKGVPHNTGEKRYAFA